MYEIQKDDSIPINLQLYDGAASMPKRVFVELSKPNGDLVEPRFEIPHILNGDFREDSKLMTDDNYLVAQYFVYENDGVTQDEDYIINKDIYMRDLTGEIVESGGVGGAAVTVIQGELTGIIEDTTIEGLVLDNPEISGTIETDITIIGEIDEC